jgi:ABC-type Na+ efflux pump, permease component
MSFLAFLKKELMEILRTSKIIILPALFLFFGMLSPISAKYTNEILAMVGEQQGVKIILPDPTYIQSYEQLFKNLYSMMIIVIILMFAGSVAEEKMKGTAILVLTKRLSKQEFILGKILGAVLLFTISYVVSAAVCVYYTGLIFKVFLTGEIAIALLAYWIFGILILSLSFLSSILFKTYAAAAIGGFAGFAVFSALGAIPYIKDYTPGILQGLSLKIISGSSAINDVILPAVLTIFISLVAVTLGIRTFAKQEL